MEISESSLTPPGSEPFLITLALSVDLTSYTNTGDPLVNSMHTILIHRLTLKICPSYD